MDQAEHRLLERVDGAQETLVRRLRELVAIPTVNPYSGDDSAASESAGQEWIADLFTRLGARPRRVPVPHDVYERGGVIGPAGRSWQGRDNVVAEWTVGDGP